MDYIPSNGQLRFIAADSCGASGCFGKRSSAGLSKRPANCQSRWCLKAECTSGQNSLTTKFAPSRITLVSQR
jgi:hypothetical protein